MTIFPLALLAAVQATEAPPIPTFFTGEHLYEVCQRPSDGRALCMMYVAGVMDGMFYARSRGGGNPLCPSPINNREAAEVVADYLEAHPSLRQLAAARIVRLATAERLRCGQTRD
jgi:hypothetical protein